MPDHTTVLLLGGTGPAGLITARVLLERGHRVVAYARNPVKFGDLAVTFPATFIPVQGSIEGPTVEHDLSSALLSFPDSPLSAVVSLLGPNTISWGGSYPFAAFYARILPVLKEKAVKRVMVLSTFSKWVDGDQFSLGRSLAVFLVTVVVPSAKKEMVAIADLFATSNLAKDIEWTVFRVGGVVDGDKGTVGAGYLGSPGFTWSITRTGIAAWVADEIESGSSEWVGKVPYICNVG
ncbi:hypothetical protein M427DRAFT_132556 [Gonapodya prolifera JEL478]|uniref:NAD(P)-binding domain-containing protein n=1 Tax=Gonapodya prolifera (strain JEL478) TaxID=1344416 RepID=A0A139APC3_GONPJ|nr:hypothetical protein M427DRAFT_132556 [Gonapodya prolifera JEL478]|eukprot:KXS18599.1 hypothetical protein M427DRAFT_132556 [Gonapodya prolifera JEL478]